VEHAHFVEDAEEESTHNETVRPEPFDDAQDRLRPQGEVEGRGHGLGCLQKAARERKHVFAALMEAVKTHSLGQISHALYDVGGEYRRNM
jgi:methylmalonyl-CoA mutase N-terminal domain/subunit